MMVMEFKVVYGGNVDGDWSLRWCSGGNVDGDSDDGGDLCLRFKVV